MTYTQQLVEDLIALGDKKPAKFTLVKLNGKLVHDVSSIYILSERNMYVLSFYLIISSANTFILVTEWKIRVFYWMLEFACTLWHAADSVTDLTLHFSCLSPNSLFKLYYSKFWNGSSVACNINSGSILYQDTEFHCFQICKCRNNIHNEMFP